VQALVREVNKHTKGFDNDVQMTNEKIGVLEATQLATDTKHETMEASVARINTSLAALLRHFDDLTTQEHDRHQGHNNNNNNYDEQVDNNWDKYSADSELDDVTTREHDRQQGYNNYNNNHLDEQVADNWDEYSADSELDNYDARRLAQHNCHGRGGH
jgi:hypothetical protein